MGAMGWKGGGRAGKGGSVWERAGEALESEGGAGLCRKPRVWPVSCLPGGVVIYLI